ncbi:hypothetical protein FA15DRAFT_654695 [Coprinopsis marcescibilis]|nr:hypothetical protein FA15DRAFT_654695 [Coprinopsis marcescibilis]
MKIHLLLNPMDPVKDGKPLTGSSYYEAESPASPEEDLCASAQHKADEDEPMDIDLPLDPVPEPFRVILPAPDPVTPTGYCEPVNLPIPEEILSAAAQHEAEENELATNVIILCSWLSRETGLTCDESIRGGAEAVLNHIVDIHSDGMECLWELWNHGDDVDEYGIPCLDKKQSYNTGKHVFRKKHDLRGYHVTDKNVEYLFKTLTCGGCGKEFPHYIGGDSKPYYNHAVTDNPGTGCTAAWTELKRLRKRRKIDNANARKGATGVFVTPEGWYRLNFGDN